MRGPPTFPIDDPDWLKRIKDEARLLGEARMLRDDDIYTPEAHEQIAARFRAYLASTGKSMKWAARALDMKPTTLSEVISNTYKGHTETYIRQIDKWIDQSISQSSAQAPSNFVNTSAALHIIGMAKIAHQHRKLALIYGPAGIGKTLTAEYLASEYQGSIYITVGEGMATPTGLFAAICRELKITGVRLTLAQMENAVIDVLKDSGRMILIDEVQALVVGSKRAKAEGTLTALRKLHDATKCPMLWFGTADVMAYLRGGKTYRQGVDQLYRRVTLSLDLAGAIANRDPNDPGWTTIEDVKKLCAARGMRLTPGAAEELQTLANTPGECSYSAIDVIIFIASVILKQDTLTPELVQDAIAKRHGRTQAKVTQSKMQADKRRTA
jgi:DNA transposition AAA+ family ATPase